MLTQFNNEIVWILDEDIHNNIYDNNHQINHAVASEAIKPSSLYTHSVVDSISN